MAVPRGRQPAPRILSAVKRALIPLVVLFSTACTTIGEERVEGWPELRVVEHYVPHQVMRERCAKYVPLLMSPEACAEFDFASGRCDLWFSADFPPPRFIVEHERQHCLGYEHAGESGLREILANHLAATANASAGAGTAPRVENSNPLGLTNPDGS